MLELSPNTMSEAEVSLRLAIFVAGQSADNSTINVAIDGAQVQVKDREIFSLREFMFSNGWQSDNADSWRATYTKSEHRSILVHSSPGQGDVVASLSGGRLLRAESKKEPLHRSASSKEYPLIREAIGQLMTVSQTCDNDLLAIALPDSPRFQELAMRWREAPLMKKLGIRILLVDCRGNVAGF